MPFRDFVDLNNSRIETALRLEQPDQVPIQVYTAGDYLSRFIGVKPVEYYRDAKIMLAAQMAFRRRFYGLGCLGPDYSVVIEPSAFGASVIWREMEPPFPKPLLSNLEDVEKLEVPDPYSAGLIPALISTYRYMVEKVGERYVDPLTGALGPFDIAVLLRGTSQFLIDIAMKRDLVHKLLEKTTKFCEEFIKAREAISEVEWTTVYLGDDYPAFLSPNDFREFYIPYARSIFDKYKKKGRLCLWHCDGKFSERTLALIPELGIDGFLWPCPDIDLSVYKKSFGKKMALMGNLHSHLLMRSTPAEVDAAVKDQIKKGAPGGGYVFSLGGEVIHGTPPDNIETMIRAVEKYGKYPVSP